MKEKPMLGNIIENFLRKLGKPLVTFVSRLGQLSLFIAQSLYNTVTPPFYLRLVGRQFLDIGFYSLPVVALTTIFAGMVIALQTYSGFSSFGAESAVAQVVLISVPFMVSLLSHPCRFYPARLPLPSPPCQGPS